MTVTINKGSTGNLSFTANFVETIIVTIGVSKPEGSQATYKFAEYATTNDAMSNTGAIQTLENKTGTMEIAKGHVLGITATVTPESGNKYELLWIYKGSTLLTDMPVEAMDTKAANGRLTLSENTTIRLEFFSAYRVQLEQTTAESDKTTTVGWTVTVDTTNSIQKEENKDYIIRDNTTWTAKVDTTGLNSSTDIVMGVSYRLASDPETEHIVGSGDQNVQYNSQDNTYTIDKAQVISIRPIVKTPVAIEIKDNTVTMISVTDGITKGGLGETQVYADTWIITFGSAQPSSAEEAAQQAFGKSTTTWTNGKYTFTVTYANNQFKLKITLT